MFEPSSIKSLLKKDIDESGQIPSSLLKELNINNIDNIEDELSDSDYNIEKEIYNIRRKDPIKINADEFDKINDVDIASYS